MISTINELVDYSQINNPVGALLLTGECGCGKTYLVEHDLRKKLEDTHVIIRVSFFGVSSTEELNKAVKSLTLLKFFSRHLWEFVWSEKAN